VRIVAVNGEFDANDTSALVTIAQEAVEDEFTTEKLATYGLSEDVLSFNFGQEEENQDSFASMGQAAGPLFLAMFVVMALLFRSLLQPLLILTALPFAIFGVASGLYLTNNDISFFSMLGVFALIGISLNNTILLTDYANQAAKSTRRASEAMAAAIRERLRPLLTTSLTSVFALLPLALNDPFWEGLAYTLIFGLISSTILVLLVFPYYYLINDSISRGLKSLYSRVVKTVNR
jgi:multidrug efflux pump subunit AcrB